MSVSTDTIFALSSGRPPAAIAVVRVSGPHAGDALKALGVKAIKPREAKFVRLRDPETGTIIDEAVVLWFPSPRSETGEDLAELQVHGGRAVIAAVLAALGKIEDLRPAEAGEFTRRAFENGKIDLTAVEGLADLVMAETEGQRRQSLRQMQGSLTRQVESWRARLIQALALVEAGIDFSDEADVPEELVGPALAIVRGLEREIVAALTDSRRGERLREGLIVAITGPPNAGKSTLLNRIAQRDVAIVSPYAGTTRDVIEVHLDLGGLPVKLLDTAGIRPTKDPVEIEGVRRARERAAMADLVLWVEDASAVMGSGVQECSQECSSESTLGEDPQIQDLKKTFTPPLNSGPFSPVSGFTHTEHGSEAFRQPPAIWLVRNKIDLLNQHPQRNEFEIQLQNYEFNISAVLGVGFDLLLAELSRTAERFLAGSESTLITRARHRRALEETLDALQRALARPLAEQEDLVAEELHLAAAALGRLTGRVDVEDVLDVIFRDFCVGK
jgi:tRNA modification GTPase